MEEANQITISQIAGIVTFFAQTPVTFIYGAAMIIAGIIGILGTCIKIWIVMVVFIMLCVFFIVLGVIFIVVCAFQSCSLFSFLVLVAGIVFFAIASCSAFIVLKEHKRGKAYIADIGSRNKS
eukprot:TRINITY_DN1407_c0_g1_i2.p1 TRINITY_DN1407_c0_g1~~TRINITY_DN1407_c0_g1_i2.p1  ORF type:complete len:137 (+),score=9.18 TRINITY_DN1407_c0_g1_i2:44-412(+)